MTPQKTTKEVKLNPKMSQFSVKNIMKRIKNITKVLKLKVITKNTIKIIKEIKIKTKISIQMMDTTEIKIKTFNKVEWVKLGSLY
jgi:hypothetical protein